MRVEHKRDNGRSGSGVWRNAKLGEWKARENQSIFLLETGAVLSRDFPHSENTNNLNNTHIHNIFHKSKIWNVKKIVRGQRKVEEKPWEKRNYKKKKEKKKKKKKKSFDSYLLCGAVRFHPSLPCRQEVDTPTHPGTLNQVDACMHMGESKFPQG